MRRKLWAWGGVVAPAVVLAVLVWRVGTGPFLAGVRTIDVGALAAAAGIAALTTICCAWRWRIVAQNLGVDITLRAAVAAYYRSQFLNLTLPGGVIGDVHRGVSHGRDVSDVGRALRAVAWERSAGQFVQVLLTAIVLLALPSPVRPVMPIVAGAVGLTILGVVLGARAHRAEGQSVLARVRRVAASDIRTALLARRAWPRVGLASTLVVVGHATTFMIAARTVGATAPLSVLLPVALVAMMGMVLPSVGGWGPREGITAWAFGAAGLGAQRGVSTAVAYGVLVLVASLPGAAVLVVAWFRRTRPPARSQTTLREHAVHA